jgi:glutamate/tyrosine decarboxylase-like PLP-dependent enzyme
MNFDLDRETRRKLGYKLIDAINDYFSSLPERGVQLPLEQRTFGELRDRLPEVGEDAAKVLDEICAELVNKGFHVPSANYFGLMNPTPTYMAVLAEALVAALNPQLATLARSQLASKIEKESVRWIAERVGWPAAFDGTFTSGGNEANFSAMALALAHHFPNAIEEGMSSTGAQPVLYASSESHHSLDKSAGLLGLGRKALRRITVNRELGLGVEQLEAAINADKRNGHRPFCVVATSGTTNSGALDDLVALADLCRRHRLWLHVDGAYGAAAIFSDKHRHLVRGIEQADSITIDPHKWLAMPFAAGVVLTRHPEMLQQAFGVATPYMPRGTPGSLPANLVDNFKVSTQWSRRMNSLKFWLTIRVHGRQAYEELIDRQLSQAAEFAKWVKATPYFELVVEPQLTIVNFRVKIAGGEEAVAHANASVVEEVTRDGQRWISTTVVNGRSVIRVMVISYLTSEQQLRSLQDALAAAAERIVNKGTVAVR